MGLGLSPAPSIFETMSAEEPSWDSTLDEWLTSSSAEGREPCWAAALAQKEGDASLYAAAPAANEEGWSIVYADPKEQTILQDDGSEKTVAITEADCLKFMIQAMEKDNAHAGSIKPPNGLFIAGVKWTITQLSKEDIGDKSLPVAFITRPKMGGFVILTDTQVLLPLYNEEKGHTSGLCKKGSLVFAEYLVGLGL